MSPAGFRKAETFLNRRRIQENPERKKSKERLPALGPESQKTIKMTGFFFDGCELCSEVEEKMYILETPILLQ